MTRINCNHCVFYFSANPDVPVQVPPAEPGKIVKFLKIGTIKIITIILLKMDYGLLN